jgi:hypothetical protein
LPQVVGRFGAGVLLDHAEPAQLVLEPVAAALAAGQAGGEDHPVVGQGGGRDSVLGHGSAELGEHDRAGDPVVRGHRQRVAGVVVEPGQDLHVLPGAAVAGEPVMGEVGLPGLVRLLGLEPEIGGLRFLPRLRGDQAAGGQMSADGGPGDPETVVVLQVPADGVRTRVQAGTVQLLVEPDDEVHHLVGSGVR